MKKAVLIGLLIFMAGFASAEVFYEVEVDEEQVLMNTTVQLECNGNDCPVNRWRLSWTQPENSEILFIRDSYGAIEDYDVEGNTISMRTNRGEARHEETVQIGFRVEEPAENIYEDLHWRRFRLPSFSDRRTSGIIEVDNLISGWVSHGFRSSFESDQMEFEGHGPVNIRLNFGEGEKTEYYEFFGNRQGYTERAYEISLGTTGLVQEFERFPIAVLPDEVYDQQVNEWSAGEYIQGSIRMRESLDQSFIPVLAHETVHGLNDRELRWDRTGTTYFDEGTSMYVEFLVRNKLYNEGDIDRKSSEVFGSEQTYTVERDGERYRYRIPPRGDKEELWDYYRNKDDDMKTWSPERHERRGFGYAYSQLMIQNFIARDNGNLRELYNDIEVEHRVDDPEEKWQIYSQHLDMEPCNYESRQRFENCLEEINSYNYPIYTGKPNRDQQTLNLERIQVPNRTVSQPTVPGVESEALDNFMYNFLLGLENFLQNLTNWIYSLRQ